MVIIQLLKDTKYPANYQIIIDSSLGNFAVQRDFFSALHGSGCRNPRLASARRDGGRVKRSRRFCQRAKSPTLLTPEEASSLAVEWQPSEKNETDNHISVTFFLFSPAPVPERICSSPLLLLQYFEKPTCF